MSFLALLSLLLILLLTMTDSLLVTTPSSSRYHFARSHRVSNSNKFFHPSPASQWRLSPSHQRSFSIRSSSRSSSSSTALSSLSIDRAVAGASIAATAKLLSAIALGGWAAKIPNVLDPAAVSALSRLTYWIFQPAFLLSSVSRTFYNAAQGGTGMTTPFLALMPFTALLHISLGIAVGWGITKFFAFSSSDEARNVRMCTAFGNSAPLPLLFADALFGGNPSLQSDVVACISFYLLVWSPLFWSYGKVILGTIDTTTTTSSSTPLKQRIRQQLQMWLSPPVIGCLLGMVVGTIPWLRHVLYQGWATPLMGSLATLGTAYLPAVLLVLAGSLVGGGKTTSTSQASNSDNAVNGDDTGASSSKPSFKALISVVLSRFVLTPLLSFAIWRSFATLGWMGPAGTRSRAIVTYVLLCQGCMPPAQNSVVMLQLAGFTQRAKTLAQLLTILYAFAVLPVTLLLSGCLSASGIMAFR